MRLGSTNVVAPVAVEIRVAQLGRTSMPAYSVRTAQSAVGIVGSGWRGGGPRGP